MKYWSIILGLLCGTLYAVTEKITLQERFAQIEADFDKEIFLIQEADKLKAVLSREKQALCALRLLKERSNIEEEYIQRLDNNVIALVRLRDSQQTREDFADQQADQPTIDNIITHLNTQRLNKNTAILQAYFNYVQALESAVHGTE